MNQNQNSEQPEALEVVSASVVEASERAQIDIQITTAKKYPRDIATVKRAMLSYATLDPETAAGCFYTLPARKGGDGKPIQGPSVRMAEIAVSSFGHIRAGMRVVANDGRTLTAQGFCHDLQTNVCITMEVKRRITKRDGSSYSEDMQAVAGMAACSIAFRNAVFKVIPGALIKPVYQEAMRTAVGDSKTLTTRRADALAAFAKMGVSKEKVFAAIKVAGIEAIDLAHLEVLIGYFNAIKEGETTIDEVFNPVADDTAKPATGAGLRSIDNAQGASEARLAHTHPVAGSTPAPASTSSSKS